MRRPIRGAPLVACKTFFRRVEALSAEGLREHPALISYDDTGEVSGRMSYQERCRGDKQELVFSKGRPKCPITNLL